MDKWYRIRCRDSKGKSCVYIDNIEDITKAYYLIAQLGSNQHPSRKYYIDVIKPELASVVTHKVAEKRYLEMQKAKEKKDE